MDHKAKEMIILLEQGKLPGDDKRARKLLLQQSLFALCNNVLYKVDPTKRTKQVVVPQQMCGKLIEEYHRGRMGGHFAADRTFKAMAVRWWWEGMYQDITKFVNGYLECAIVSGGGRVKKPPLCPIPVQRLFQIVGVDIMTLPRTTQGNQYVLVIQDFLSKWPMVYALPDQQAHHLVKILEEEVVPVFGVPEALLSNRGTNLLSHLMDDVCKLLDIHKLNTTAYHPQANGLVERFNRTLKAMLRKHAQQFGFQWDRFLYGVQWAYRNTPHSTTGEKPSFLLFGTDLRAPSEAALCSPTPMYHLELEDYRNELILLLSSARELAAASIQKVQQKYKKNYDSKSSSRSYQEGEWILIRFPQEETGKL